MKTVNMWLFYCVKIIWY